MNPNNPNEKAMTLYDSTANCPKCGHGSHLTIFRAENDPYDYNENYRHKEYGYLFSLNTVKADHIRTVCRECGYHKYWLPLDSVVVQSVNE